MRQALVLSISYSLAVFVCFLVDTHIYAGCIHTTTADALSEWIIPECEYVLVRIGVTSEMMIDWDFSLLLAQKPSSILTHTHIPFAHGISSISIHFWCQINLRSVDSCFKNEKKSNQLLLFSMACRCCCPWQFHYKPVNAKQRLIIIIHSAKKFERHFQRFFFATIFLQWFFCNDFFSAVPRDFFCRLTRGRLFFNRFTLG